MIGVLIPGVPLMNGGPLTSNMVVLDVKDPKNVNNIGLFLQEPIPEGFGAALYYSIPPFENLCFVGCIANIRPSDVFYTGWSLNPEVNCHPMIKICIKLDKLEDVKVAYGDKIKDDSNQQFAKRIAKNLFNYLDSFNQNQDPYKNLLVVPLNTLECWYDKFTKQYSVDPNFIMKTS